MNENFTLCEIGKTAYVEFVSEQGIKLLIPKHKYLFTQRSMALMDKVMSEINKYGDEMYE